MSGFLTNPGLLDPRVSGRRMMSPLLAPEQQQGIEQNVMAPEPVQSPEPSVHDETLQMPDLSPLQENVRHSNQALVDKANEMGQMAPYEPKKRGVGSRIGEGILSMFSPSAANIIFETPERQRYQAYEAGLNQQQRQLQALNYAAQNAERELNINREGVRDQAYWNWMNRRQNAEPKVEVIVGSDGKPHKFQYNQKSNRYDIDLGLNYEKPTNENDVEYFQRDPEGYGRFLDTKKKHGFGPGADQPHGSYIPMVDDSGHLNGAWNPTNNVFRPVPKQGEGNYRTPPNKTKDFFTAQRLASANLSKNLDFVMGTPEEQSKMLATETQRIMDAAGASGEPKVEAPGEPMQPTASHGSSKGKALDANTAKTYLQKANGDKNKARQLAKADGYTF